MKSERISRRRFLAATGGALAMASLGSGCTAQPASSIRFAAGEPGGFFADMAALIAQQANTSGSGLQIETLGTVGSLENISLVLEKKADFGLALADSASKYESSLRSIARVYQNYAQLLVLKDSPYASLADLRGKRVSLGPEGSGTQATAYRILHAAGLEPHDLDERPTRIARVGQALLDHDLQAALIVGVVPQKAIESVAGRNLRHIDLGAEAKYLAEHHGGEYQQVQLPSLGYGTTAAIMLLGVPAYIVCRPEIDAQLADAVATVLIERSAHLIPEDTLGTQFLDARAMINTPGLQLHQGAIAAFQRTHG